jgi:hypothetical protein
VVAVAKRVVLAVVGIIGVLLLIGTGLSGAGAYLSGGSRQAFEDFTIVWFAPLFLTPLALIGAGLVAVSSLVSKQRRALFGWSVLAVLVLLAVTAAVFNLTGLASGEIEPDESVWGTVAVIVSLAYALSVVVLGGAGALVVRDVLKAPPAEAIPPVPA